MLNRVTFYSDEWILLTLIVTQIKYKSERVKLILKRPRRTDATRVSVFQGIYIWSSYRHDV